MIYGLIDRTTEELRYVGRSSGWLYRPRSHWSVKALKRNDPCHCWTRSLAERGLIPDILVIEDFEKTEDVSLILDDAEIFWIAYFRSIGCHLLNMTAGGDSLPDTRGEKNWMFGRKHRKESKALMSANRLGKKHSEETKALIRAAHSGKKLPEQQVINSGLAKRKRTICLNDGREFQAIYILLRSITESVFLE